MADNAPSDGGQARIVGIDISIACRLRMRVWPIDDIQPIGNRRPGQKIGIVDKFTSMSEIVHGVILSHQWPKCGKVLVRVSHRKAGAARLGIGPNARSDGKWLPRSDYALLQSYTYRGADRIISTASEHENVCRQNALFR